MSGDDEKSGGCKCWHVVCILLAVLVLLGGATTGVLFGVGVIGGAKNDNGGGGGVTAKVRTRAIVVFLVIVCSGKAGHFEFYFHVLLY